MVREPEGYMKQSVKLFVVEPERTGLHFLRNLKLDSGQRDGIQ